MKTAALFFSSVLFSLMLCSCAQDPTIMGSNMISDDSSGSDLSEQDSASVNSEKSCSVFSNDLNQTIPEELSKAIATLIPKYVDYERMRLGQIELKRNSITIWENGIELTLYEVDEPITNQSIQASVKEIFVERHQAQQTFSVYEQNGVSYAPHVDLGVYLNHNAEGYTVISYGVTSFGVINAVVLVPCYNQLWPYDLYVFELEDGVWKIAYHYDRIFL